MLWTKWGRIVAISACAIFLSTSSYAQAVYGTIFGSVTDNTNAAIPGATITVTDTNKGTTVTATANEAGEFTIGHLIPDTYDVSVANAGFKTFESKGLQVYADQSIKVEAKMEVGGATQTVEVSATTVEQLKTDRADVSTTFTTKEVQDLPIGDRNFTNLQLLLPGAQKLGWGHAADENPQGSQQIQVDGQAFGGVAFELDGTDNQDPILGIIVINPNMDSLTETKITTQNFDAEFGKAVSSVVTAQTKSGTNSFHGSAFDYRESNANQARDPFTQNPPAGTNNTGGLVPGGLKNQFGGSIGGPILKDKLFFFGDFQLVRQKVGTSASMTVPSAMLVSTCLGQSVGPSGIPGCDFSQYLTALGPTIGTIYEPDTINGVPNRSRGLPYPGNVIPTAQLSQQSLNLLTLLQPYAPNKTGSFNGLQNNYGASGTGIFNSDQWDERVDFQATQSIHVFERFSRFTDVLSGTTIFGPAGGAGFGIGNYGGNSKGANDSLAAGFDWAVKPTLATDFRVGYYRYNIGDDKYNQGTPFMTNLGIPGMNLNEITSGAGGFNLTDVGSGGGPNNSQSTGSQYGSDLNITRCNCPLIEREDQYQIVNNWTWIKGNHSIKFGADLRYARNLRVPSDTDRTGILSFGTGPTSNGSTGGLGFATFVQGNATAFGRYVSTSTNAKEFQKRTFFYGQDTWRVTPKLTANLGLRYELYFPETVNAPMNGSLMQMNDDTSTDGYLRVAGVGGIQSNMNWEHVTNAYNPRVGLAYQVNPKTVLRAGYGRSFDLGVFGSIFGHVVTQNLPVLANQEVSATGGPRSDVFNLADGPPACGAANGCIPVVPSNGLLPTPGYSVSPKARPNSLRLPTLDAWNASLQQSITPTLALTIAYVGNKGTHTLSAGDGNNTNPNEAGITLPSQYSIEGRQLHYVPTQLLTNPDSNGIDPDGGVNNNTLLQRYYGGSLTACRDGNYGYINGSVAPPAGLPVGSCGWTNGIGYYGDDQDSHYNALQVTLAKQFSKGLSFTGAYAWQQGIDFNSGYATWNKRAVRGRNNDIRTNTFVGYGLYQLPFGRNQKFYSSASPVMNAIVGGWQISPIVTISTGEPFTLGYGECALSVPGSAPCYPNGKGSSLKTNLGGYDAVNHRRFFYNGTTTPLVQYNAAEKALVYTPFSGFSAAGVDQIGTAGRNNVYGPGFWNADLSLQKNIPIHESILAQFRVDGFNAFNHINPGNPSGALDSGPQYITGQAPGAAARLLQFSLRVQF
jgi:outer membrane receptor protein involved in Fe transport